MKSTSPTSVALNFFCLMDSYAFRISSLVPTMIILSTYTLMIQTIVFLFFFYVNTGNTLKIFKNLTLITLYLTFNNLSCSD